MIRPGWLNFTRSASRRSFAFRQGHLSALRPSSSQLAPSQLVPARAVPARAVPARAVPARAVLPGSSLLGIGPGNAYWEAYWERQFLTRFVDGAPAMARAALPGAVTQAGLGVGCVYFSGFGRGGEG